MKKLFTLLALVFITQVAFAGSGIFDDAIKIQKNGGTETQYYFGSRCTDMLNGCSGSNSSTATNFSGASAGSGVLSLKITFAEVRTFKNGGDDITGANLFYRVYKAGDNPTYTTEAIAFGANIGGGGDQRWTETLNIELAAGLIANTAYTLEIYSTSPFTFTGGGGGSGTHTNNASGANFKLTFTTDATLSAELGRFAALMKNNTSLLAWQTASEKDNALFQIERSANGTDFSAIGEVKGAGNSSAAKNYAFTDATPLSGINYYRLKAVDYNGAATLSKVVSVTFSSKNDTKVAVYPNPTRNAISVELNAAEASTTLVQVTDLAGRVVLSQNVSVAKGANLLPFNVASLPAGAYFIKVNADVVRFVKL